jgi:predicted GH43/DUF377 family glycosyl hydrolase
MGMKSVVMNLNSHTELFQRYEKNPILTAKDWSYPANSVFNPGAVKIDNATLLLVRVEDYCGISHLTVARSPNGRDNWEIDEKPTFEPDPDNYPEEIWGIEDPRITYIEELEQWAVVYTAYSRDGPLVSIATTKDFRSYNRLGPVLPPQNKDAALFPVKFDGRWAIIHRGISHVVRNEMIGDLLLEAMEKASSDSVKKIKKAKSWASSDEMVERIDVGSHIWISFSTDMIHWNDHRILIHARKGGWWDANKIGLSTPPLRTPEGWLILYHGVRQTVAGPIYRIGIALLDLEDPTKTLNRCDNWIFGPKEWYEVEGDVKNVVFPCGLVEDNGEIRIYYGAADSHVAMATAKLSDLLDYITECEADQGG